MDKRSCVHCGRDLKGRLDQRFCDAQCRNAHHNQSKRSDEQYIGKVNTAIRKNRRILKSLCPEGKATIRREVLENRGFDYRYFSGIFISSKLTYYLYYDFGFAAIFEAGVEKALIIQKQNYMDAYILNPWSNGQL